jgi:hypothetical protein
MSTEGSGHCAPVVRPWGFWPKAWQLVSPRLHPNRIAVGFRLFARNLALGLQIREAGARPTVLREPRAFRAAHVDGLGLFVPQEDTIWRVPCQPSPPHTWHLPWTHRTVRLVA